CIAAANNSDGAPLIIRNCNTENATNQNWQLSTGADSAPQHIMIFGDKCINVKDSLNAEGTKLELLMCVGGNQNQEWIFVEDSTIRLSNTNKCINLRI
ncbi:ricin B lectin domain-containing protein, partial [Mycena olivaceomarginata]